MAKSVVIALLAICASASAAAQAPGETTAVSRRPWLGVCAGVCPSYDLTVRADGRVLVVQRHFDGPDEVRRFRVSRRDAARFRALLEPFRPAGYRRTQAKCGHAVSESEASLVLSVTELEIRWIRSRSHLVACDNPQDSDLLKALNAALRALRLNIDARRS